MLEVDREKFKDVLLSEMAHSAFPSRVISKFTGVFLALSAEAALLNAQDVANPVGEVPPASVKEDEPVSTVATCPLQSDTLIAFPVPVEDKKFRAQEVSALAVGLDGALYAGGSFKFSLDGKDICFVAVRRESQWSPLADELNGAVKRFCVTREKLSGASAEAPAQAFFAAGNFTKSSHGAELNHIAQLKEGVWHPLRSGVFRIVGEDEEQRRTPAILQMTEFKDPKRGPVLVVAGRFDEAGEKSVQNIAMWTGHEWRPLGRGISGFENAQVSALLPYKDGEKEVLIAAGHFSSAGKERVKNIAVWDGAEWKPFGAPEYVRGNIYDLCVWDDGSGPHIYAIGDFIQFQEFDPDNFRAGPVPIVSDSGLARWDGSAWRYFESVSSRARKLFPVSHGTLSGLYISGAFSSGEDEPVSSWFGRFNGQDFEQLLAPAGKVNALLLGASGSEEGIIVGGCIQPQSNRVKSGSSEQKHPPSHIVRMRCNS